ncbi:formylmethanofuran dehydrogenase [Verrucomicrobia bacterium S94]|nr:formylmethanofuran dehydrogenase [Verrucomicrobia bacterium S94]
MAAEDIMNSDDFKKCASFHGHVCPGLAIGFQSARAALDQLKQNRAADEELAAVVETDACSADAVQVLTGCTFGKGNFIFKDHGKMVLTLFSRETGKGVRVALKPDAFQPSDEHKKLMQKASSGEADAAESARYRELHLEQTRRILKTPPEELFSITAVRMKLPPRARIEPSELCPVCGEPVMPSKMEPVDGQRICRACL